MKLKRVLVRWAWIAAYLPFGSVITVEPTPSAILFSESFDDADLLKRNWKENVFTDDKWHRIGARFAT